MKQLNFLNNMDPSCTSKIFPMFRVFLWFLILLFSVCFVQSLDNINQANRTSEATLEELKMIRAYLMKINKPGIKTIKSPDGDIIDCVLSHQQLAFDHPELKGQKPLDPPEERPRGYNSSTETNEVFQIWSMSGESCPEGTVPIRRVTEEDILSFGSISTFGKKTIRSSITGDPNPKGHEYAIGYVNENAFYGGKANINLWAPKVEGQGEFSLAQIWVVSGTTADLNTVEAGWQVFPQFHKGDRQPRLFIYWTSDGYKGTGCYNFLCPGFVQTTNKIAAGAALSPVSFYGGRQYQISLLIWKDPNTKNWWLQYGDILVGYWPSSLFTHLKDHATLVEFGGEIVNSGGVDGSHTSTQMGSGHFAEEGDGKASFFRNLQVVDEHNTFIAPQNIKLLADHPSCYDIKAGFNKAFGNYFNYGGPGKNQNCH